MKKVVIILCACLFMVGCKNQSTEIDLKKIMAEQAYTIIDVRTEKEYENSHIVEAINIPLSEIETISVDKEQVIFVYCQSGNRSKQAYEVLTDMGYTVYDLGGINAIDLPKE